MVSPCCSTLPETPPCAIERLRLDDLPGSSVSPLIPDPGWQHSEISETYTTTSSSSDTSIKASEQDLWFFNAKVVKALPPAHPYRKLLQNKELFQEIHKKREEIEKFMDEKGCKVAEALIQMKGYEEYPIRLVKSKIKGVFTRMLLVTKTLPEGSFKEAYKVTDCASLDREDPRIKSVFSRVVLKHLKSDNLEQQKRFQFFAKKNARISFHFHAKIPNILVYSYVPELSGRDELYSEYCEQGNLLLYLENNKVDFKERLDIARNVAEALCGLHENGIAHLDIKSENVFVQEKGVYKLADLDLCEEVKAVGKLETKCYVTVGYKAPEMMKFKELPLKQAEYVDVWAFGILLMWLLYEDPYSQVVFNLFCAIQRMLEVIQEDKMKCDTFDYAKDKLKEYVSSYFTDKEALLKSYDEFLSHPDQQKNTPCTILNEFALALFIEHVLSYQDFLERQKTPVATLIRKILSIRVNERPKMRDVLTNLQTISG